MLSDKAICFTGAGGSEQQGAKEGKSKCDLPEQGGKRACKRRHELNANNPNAWLRPSHCRLLWLHQSLSSFQLWLYLGNFTQAQTSSCCGNLGPVGDKPVAKAW